MKLQLFFLLFTTNIFCQNTYRVLDNENKEPIPYALIETQGYKVNSGEDGIFFIPDSLKHQLFQIGAVGYVRNNLILTKPKVYLKADSEILEEMIIIPKKSTKTQKIGSFKKKIFNNVRFLSNTDNENPYKMGRFFPSNNTIQSTPFIEKIVFLTASEHNSSKYQIKIYRADSQGLPSTLLHDEPIIGIAKKGRNKSETDIRDHKIIFPESGVFIVFEWLALVDNYYEITAYDTKSQRKETKGYHNPKLMASHSKTPSTSKINFSIPNISEKWQEIDFFDHPNEKKIGIEIYCELILSN